MGVKLSYDFAAGAISPDGDASQLRNPLFAMLTAIRESGSIGRAATRLGVSYRHLWGAVKRHEAAFGQRLLAGGQGQAASLSEFGERLLWAERQILARVLPQAEGLAQQIDRELLLAIDPGLELLPALVGYDPVFGPLREHLQRESRLLLDLRYAHSPYALARLNEGACTLATVHLPLGDERLCRRGGPIHAAIGRHLRLGEHKMIRCVSREQGLMVAPGNPHGLSRIEDLRQPGIAFLNRARGGGARLLLDELIGAAGLPPRSIAGYLSAEPTHLAVAAGVAAGAADCGFGLRAAAGRFGLDFVPLVVEQLFVVCRTAMLDTPGMRALVETLGASGFADMVKDLPGYGSEVAGQVVSLRRTLPWYK